MESEWEKKREEILINSGFCCGRRELRISWRITVFLWTISSRFVSSPAIWMVSRLQDRIMRENVVTTWSFSSLSNSRNSPSGEDTNRQLESQWKTSETGRGNSSWELSKTMEHDMPPSSYGSRWTAEVEEARFPSLLPSHLFASIHIEHLGIYVDNNSASRPFPKVDHQSLIEIDAEDTAEWIADHRVASRGTRPDSNTLALRIDHFIVGSDRPTLRNGYFGFGSLSSPSPSTLHTRQETTLQGCARHRQWTSPCSQQLFPRRVPSYPAKSRNCRWVAAFQLQRRERILPNP